MNRLALLVGLTVMELGWIYPWSLLVGTWATPERPRALLSPFSVYGLLLVGALATSGIVRAFGPRRPGQVVLVALGIVGVVMAVKVDQFPSTAGAGWLDQLVRDVGGLLGRPTAPSMAFALALFLWWRAVRIGSAELTFWDVEVTFRWGIGLLVLGGLLLAVATPGWARASLEDEAAPFVVGFFFVSLLTLALARLESLRSRTRALALNTQWLAVLIAVAGLLVLSALVVAQVLSFDVLVVATQPLFNLIGFVLLLLILVAVIPLAYIVEWIVYLILQLIQPDPNQPPPQPLQPSEIQEALRRLLAQAFAPEVIDAARTVGVVILLALGLLLMARTIARWRPSSLQADAADEERDTLWDADRVRAALLAWLRGLLRRRSTAAAPSPSPVAEAELSTRAQERSIRALYRRLLHLGSTAGAPRPLAATPFEHLPSLTRALEPQDDLSELTDAYVLARYADQPPPSPQLEDLGLRLDRVQRRVTEDAPTPEHPD